MARLVWRLTSSQKAKRQCLLASSHTSAASRKKWMKRRSEVGTSTADRELVEAMLKSARTHPMKKARSRIQKEHRSFAPTCTFAEPPGQALMRRTLPSGRTSDGKMMVRRKVVAATVSISGEGLEEDKTKHAFMASAVTHVNHRQDYTGLRDL